MVANAQVTLTELAEKLANRTNQRTEANVQAALHAFLLMAPLQLEEVDLHDIVLEQPTGKRRRVDVEVGYCVFEVKRDLRKGNVRIDAEQQLAGYVETRSVETVQDYVGVLTDGAEWHLYRLQDSNLQHVSSFELSPNNPDTDGLVVWLEAVLATSERLTPSPSEIRRLLGAGTPGYLLNVARLTELYEANRNDPAVKLKRQLYAKLLSTALGTAFTDDDELFIRHSLLVVMAEIIAHAVLRFDPNLVPPRALVSGQQFRAVKVLGVVESDFFDWPAEVPGGEAFVQSLTRRVARFEWSDVDHDVLKVLYESIISPAQRKQLGEYYTPDWLAEVLVNTTVKKPLEERTLDPSCGSGTFLFHAVRRYLSAADEAGIGNQEALAGLCSNVLGMDLHPVAVTLARVTYLTAIGSKRLKGERGPISIPVFLGDSLQWGQEESIQHHGELVVLADDDLTLFENELRFPDRLVADAGRFDALVAELAELACDPERGNKVPSLATLHRRFAIPDNEQEVLEATFRLMCLLHDQGRNHIWGYYVRNLARPRWLARPENRVDVLFGNPPWLSFRFMTPEMQTEFQKWSLERGLWAGAKSATHVDLSSLFVVRCIERYLKQEGAFAFVMPFATLSRQHFVGFRGGDWPQENGFPVYAEFDTAWDLHAVKPPFFEVPCCTVRGRRGDKPRPIPSVVEKWEGRLDNPSAPWLKVQPQLTHTEQKIEVPGQRGKPSALAKRFTQGASLAPRMLLFVEELPSGPLGVPAGEVRVRSRRTAYEKRPWKELPGLEGVVEKNFVFPVYLGETVLPFATVQPLAAVIPWDGKRLLHGEHELISSYPGMQKWWRAAETCWEENRSSDRLSLVQQIDFRRKLSGQFDANGQCAPVRLVYTKSGMYLAAAIVTDPTAVIDTKLYWAACASMDEAHYLSAVLNAPAVTMAVRSYQPRGEHNPRDFDKYIWELGIPPYDPKDPLHRELAELAESARVFVESLVLPTRRFEHRRRFVRDRLAETSVGESIEQSVQRLLANSSTE